MRIKIYPAKTKDKQWYFTLCSRNGKVIATSETYKSLRGVLLGISVIKRSMDRLSQLRLEFQLERQLDKLKKKQRV